jgi:hypothetical protein
MAHTETWYAWRELRQVEGEDVPRLLVPWGDPHQYEYDFNYYFATPEEAKRTKEEDLLGPSSEEDWLLVKLTMEVVE